jgi:transposase
MGRGTKGSAKRFAIDDLADVHERCAGIDVHKNSLSVCLIVGGAGAGAEGEVRQFGTATAQLRELSAWLEQEGVTHVVMESTGVYWKPVWQILDNGKVSLLLANARSVKNMPGRKTDQADCIWLATLRIQKVLEEANIKLDSVLTDVMGVSGRAMLSSLSEGETDEEKLAELAVPQLRAKMPELKQALEGTMRPHQRFVLKQWLTAFEELDRHIGECEQEIEAYAAPFEQQVGRLDEIPGVNRIGAIAILSEIGVEMSAFATADRLCAWAGVCPGNNITGGKSKKARARNGNRWLRGILTQCAWAATRTKKSYFHAQYRRLVGRCGNNKSLVAAAHSLLATIWHMLQRNEPYRDLGADYFDRINTQNQKRTCIRKLERLGYRVILEKAA